MVVLPACFAQFGPASWFSQVHPANVELPAGGLTNQVARAPDRHPHGSPDASPNCAFFQLRRPAQR
jgi:hypothetical protein